jgi:hypothetical protein
MATLLGSKNKRLTAEAQRRRDFAEKTIVLKLFSAKSLRLCASAVRV